MSLSAIPRDLRNRVFRRDEGRCRYCHLSQVGQAGVFHINHINPKSKGGKTVLANLVLQCPHCSLHKSNKTSELDLISGKVTPLFHPLTQVWNEHFALDSNGICSGKNDVGRVTIEALRMNDPLPRIARSVQIRIGLLLATES